jgi:hypothetical protein
MISGQKLRALDHEAGQGKTQSSSMKSYHRYTRMFVLHHTNMLYFAGMELIPTVGEVALKVVTRHYFIDLSTRTMSLLLAF